MQAVVYPHIEIRADGRPVIAGTGMKVTFIAMEWLAYHWDADEIQRQHPHLTKGQIHSALAYYHDHEEQMHQLIADEQAQIEEFFKKNSNPALRAKLQEAKRRRIQGS